MPPTERVLLVECVNADQHPGRVAVLYPFLSGFLARQAIPTRWVRFGIATTNPLVHARDELTLSEAELELLLGVAREHRPTAIVLTDRLAEAQEASLIAACPGARLHALRDGTPAFSGLPAFRGVRELEDPDFVPLFDWQPGNAAALAKEIDNLYLSTEETCGYRALVAANPLFSGLDDERVRDRRGCAFCSNWIDPRGETRAIPTEWVLRQVRAAARRVSPDGAPGGFLLARVEAASVLEATAGAMTEVGLAGRTQLLVAVRADQADALASFVRAWYAAHPESPLVVGVYACGIESFVDDELARFNKGLTPSDGLNALATFRALAAELPGRFWYSGLTFILFTPWTTLEDLRHNVSLLVSLAFVEARNVFESRLRLHPRLAITALAERDGLLVDDEPDPVLIMNRRKLFEGELAWRFADPRVRPVCQLALRFDLCDEVASDELTVKVRRVLGDERFVASQEDRLRLLLDLVEAAATRPEPFEPAELFGLGLELFLARRPAAPAQTPATPTPATPPQASDASAPDPSRLQRLAEVLVRLIEQHPGRFPGLALVAAPEGSARARARVRATIDDRAYELELSDARSAGPCLFRTRFFAVSHAADTPLTRVDDRARIEQAFAALERALLKRAAG